MKPHYHKHISQRYQTEYFGKSSCPQCQPIKQVNPSRILPITRQSEQSQQPDNPLSSPLDQPMYIPRDKKYSPEEIFPRMNVKDPYQRLGITPEASFEEIQEAHNFLFEQHKRHKPSRESIELALDSILKEKYNDRMKRGFTPPSTGRRTDAVAQPKLTIGERIRSFFEADIPIASVLNEGLVYAILAIWGYLQYTQAKLNSPLPLILGIGYTVYRMYNKRKARNPDGPYIGGTPFFGAVLVGLGSVGLGFGLSMVVPVPTRFAIAMQQSIVVPLLFILFVQAVFVIAVK